jgi:aryl-alcohol dehydrogenase-like predicted oxidoreductase
LNYGINNSRGRIPREEAHEILRYCLRNEICTIDTAHSYGESEEVIGRFVQENNPNFEIVSKSSAGNSYELKKFFNESLSRLSLKSIYGYLIHNFKLFTVDMTIWDTLKNFQERRQVEKIGFSLYYPEEAEYILDARMEVNLIQIPYSIFDRRFSYIFPLLKERGVEIYARSVFLQGLAFKSPEELDPGFSEIKNKLLFLQALCRERNVPISAVCVSFACSNPYIDRVIVGVDSLKHLENNVNIFSYKDDINDINDQLNTFQVNNVDIVVPTRWKGRT